MSKARTLGLVILIEVCLLLLAHRWGVSDTGTTLATLALSVGLMVGRVLGKSEQS